MNQAQRVRGGPVCLSLLKVSQAWGGVVWSFHDILAAAGWMTPRPLAPQRRALGSDYQNLSLP